MLAKRLGSLLPRGFAAIRPSSSLLFRPSRGMYYDMLLLYLCYYTSLLISHNHNNDVVVCFVMYCDS